MKVVKNRKGFTLVELLAVIVILALIMGIAAYSMQGVTENVRISSMKSSALSFIDGVRTSLLSTMNLKEGNYYFNEKILETDVESPWGGKYVYYNKTENGTPDETTSSLNANGYATAAETDDKVCGGNGSFVRVRALGNGTYSYEACLYDSLGHFVYASEQVLTNSSTKSDYYRQNAATDATFCLSNGTIDSCE